MARGTQERFAQYANPLRNRNFVDDPEKLNLQPCGVCGRLLGLHSDAQVFQCKHKQLAERRGSK